LHIGHINLATSMNDFGEHFIRLVEALDRQRIHQHVLVANASLSKRIAICEHVKLGPVVRTPVMAYCLMPDVGLTHVHDARGGQSGLLLTLTRSIPYVITRREPNHIGRNPLARSMLSRAASVICPTRDMAESVLAEDFSTPVDVIPDIPHESLDENVIDNRIAAEHLRIYRRAVDSWRVPAMLL